MNNLKKKLRRPVKKNQNINQTGSSTLHYITRQSLSVRQLQYKIKVQ